MKKISSVEDLQVYRKLCALHLEINDITIKFPEFELYELGAQLRKSSNAAPASIAEGLHNKRLNLEVIHKVLGELNGTKHYLNIAFKKCYIKQSKYEDLMRQCDECGRLLHSLEKSIYWRSKPSPFTKNQFTTINNRRQ